MSELGFEKSLFWPIVMINLFSAFLGFVFFYGPQLAETPIYLWPFVPDCPLYALLVAVALVLARTNVKADLFFFITGIGALKYGFWTVFVLSSYSSFYLPISQLQYMLLFFGHIGLFLEAFIFSKKIDVKNWYVVVALVWFVANDFSDYVWNTRPYLPDYSLSLIYPLTLTMSFAFTIFGYYLYKKLKEPVFEIV
ncbi:DUF1405 domain-containing protein [Candidatus Micrarchaeota archaeon]|nr:DUF1405 domain-containing protein [Candidatus Micrarchaeota archaeon]